MENKGLLFIPDISGFTLFINETEINHSRLIIQELLETIINANHIGLVVSEIEGDAILFYKFGEPPSLEELYSQVEKMFCAFHRSLNAYEQRRYCQCKACVSAISLTLKVITHYGEFIGYNVKEFSKLIGKDVIIAHQLLKNDIDQHEYWLVTKNLLPGKQPASFANWMDWNKSTKQIENGEVPFYYTLLSQLKNKAVPEPLKQPDLSNKIKMMSGSKEYETDIITLFHATGNFNYRSQWKEDVKKVEDVSYILPRVGMKCRCTLKNGRVVTYTTTSFTYQAHRIEFGETDEENKYFTNFILEKVSGTTVRLSMDFYIPKNNVIQPLFYWKRKKVMKTSLQQSLENLVGLLKVITID